MGKIVFILGGARSGKSSLAARMAKEACAGTVWFIATAEILDSEMARRVLAHRRSRPSRWRTYEEPIDVLGAVKKIGRKPGMIIIDCVTLLVSNMMLAGSSAKKIEGEAAGIASACRKTKADCIIVSNEVGLGVVPENRLGREFRDVAGRVNQIIAREADEVFFTAAGIPWRIK